MESKQSLLRSLRATAPPLPAAASAADPPGIPEGWSDGYLYANGVRLHYYRAIPAPGKPVIVMVHGVTDNGLCWTTLALELQDDYDIYMLDARGHGLSDPFTTADGGDTLIRDVVAAVDALGVDKPILMGHSMGAATVMHVGAGYPDLARAIIMLDPFLHGVPPDAGEHRGPREEPAVKKEPRDTSREASRSSESAGDRLPVNMAGDPGTLVAQNNYRFVDLVATGRRQFPMWDDADVLYWALSKKQYHGAYSDDGWQAMSAAMQAGDAPARITVPALILKADAPPEGRRSDEQAVDGLKHVKLAHIDGAGHNLHHDKRQRTLELLTEFLSSL